MMAVTAQMRVLVCVAAVDFRKGIDGLTRVCREVLSTDPFSGTMFVFRNRRGTAIKILAYDGQGFWLCTNRLSHGRFAWWPTASTPNVLLSAWELNVLLGNGHPDRAQLAPDWRPIRYDGTRAT